MSEESAAMLIPSFFSITERNNEKFEIFHQNVWSIQKYLLYLPRQKVTFGYPGRIPRGASLYRHYPIFQCQRCFLTIRAESREGKTLSTLPKRGEHFMLTSCFLYSQLPPNRLVTNLRYQADL